MPGTASSGGRNRRSNAEHALAGTGRKDRGTAVTPGGTTLPDPPKGRPVKPKGLRGHVLAEWNRMVHRLEQSQTLSVVDDAVLYQYCCLFAETEAIGASRRTNATLAKILQAAIKRLRTEDLIVKAITQIVQLKKLEVKYTTQLRQGHMALRSYLVEFGMTPAARSRVKVAAAPAPTDPFQEFDVPLPFDPVAKH